VIALIILCEQPRFASRVARFLQRAQSRDLGVDVREFLPGIAHLHVVVVQAETAKPTSQRQLFQPQIGALPFKPLFAHFVADRHPTASAVKRALPQHQQSRARRTGQHIDRIAEFVHYKSRLRFVVQLLEARSLTDLPEWSGLGREHLRASHGAPRWSDFGRV
jgi:hypothetical protein